MSDEPVYASLTAGLLARKGDARPAMRRQADLGWDDTGSDDMAPVTEVHRRQDEIERRFTPIAVRSAGKKSAFTLRLDSERHLRLRLACAARHRSAQQFVTAALDAMLASMPEIERLAAGVPAADED